MVYLMPSVPIPMDFWWTIGLTSIPGLIGGITYGVTLYLRASTAKPASDGLLSDWPPRGKLSTLSFYAGQALIGIGGSIAALLVILWANRFPEPLFATKSLLTVMCTSFIAGYVANRLLPAIADRLYLQLDRLAQQTNAAAEKADEAKRIGEQATAQAAASGEDAADAARLASEMVSAATYLGDRSFGNASQTKRYIHNLDELRKKFPKDPNLSLLLARLYSEAQSDRKTAIDILHTFVRAKANSGESNDVNIANVLWNLAWYCYSEGCPQKDESLCKEAIEWMDQCLKLKPDYYKPLIEDEDFKPMCESLEAADVMQRAKKAYEAWLTAHPEDGEDPVRI